MKALSPAEILRMKKETIPFNGAWQDAFGNPEWVGVWMIWGKEGSGKTSFAMQLCKELSRWKKVVYNSLEQKKSLTLQTAIRESNMVQCPRGRFQVLPGEPIDDLSTRLSGPRAPHVVVIDSLDRARLNYNEFVGFAERHSDKLIILISQADGLQPKTRTAKSILYDTDLRIRVQLYRAISEGRTRGDKGYFTVWPEKAQEHWGDEQQ